MIDAWNAQRYFILSITRKTFPLVAGQQTYEIGPTAADWVTPRPPKIEDASLISLQNPAQPLEIPLTMLTFDNWQLVGIKNITSTYPRVAWYDPAQEWLPNAKFSIFPIPQVNYDVALYAWTQIAQSVTASDPLILAPGYQQALQYQLAVELCPRWGVPVPPDVRSGALEYMKNVKSVNAPTLDLRCDAGVQSAYHNGFYNWYTDSYGAWGGF
jgi:hypothetical protein